MSQSSRNSWRTRNLHQAHAAAPKTENFYTARRQRRNQTTTPIQTSQTLNKLNNNNNRFLSHSDQQKIQNATQKKQRVVQMMQQNAKSLQNPSSTTLLQQEKKVVANPRTTFSRSTAAPKHRQRKTPGIIRIDNFDSDSEASCSSSNEWEFLDKKSTCRTRVNDKRVHNLNTQDDDCSEESSDSDIDEDDHLDANCAMCCQTAFERAKAQHLAPCTRSVRSDLNSDMILPMLSEPLYCCLGTADRLFVHFPISLYFCHQPNDSSNGDSASASKSFSSSQTNLPIEGILKYNVMLTRANTFAHTAIDGNQQQTWFETETVSTANGMPDRDKFIQSYCENCACKSCTKKAICEYKNLLRLYVKMAEKCRRKNIVKSKSRRRYCYTLPQWEVEINYLGNEGPQFAVSNLPPNDTYVDRFNDTASDQISLFRATDVSMIVTIAPCQEQVFGEWSDWYCSDMAEDRLPPVPPAEKLAVGPYEIEVDLQLGQSALRNTLQWQAQIGPIA